MKIISALLVLININLLAQINITLGEHQITDDGNIFVTVHAQNLGEGQKIWAAYGNNSYLQQTQSNFFLTYIDVLNNNEIRKKIPSSILIKTIFDNYIEMPQPDYYFPSTGRNSLEWQITFTNIPKVAGSVLVTVCGKEFKLGDIPNAYEVNKRKEEIRRRKEEEDKRKEEKLVYAINSALEKSQKKQWNDAAKYWDDAISFNSETVSKYSEIISTSFCEKALVLFAQNNYPGGKYYLEKAKNINVAVFNNYAQEYSNILYEYGDSLLSCSDINTGVESLKYSYSLSNVNREKIVNRLDEMKRSYFTTIALSIIPGLSQFVIQNNPIESSLLFAGFSISSLLTILNKIQADKYYKDYLRASTSLDAGTKYNLADTQIKKAELFLGLVVTTVVFSIMNQYSETSRYNSLFEINSKLTTTFNKPNNDSFYLTINIPF